MKKKIVTYTLIASTLIMSSAGVLANELPIKQNEIPINYTLQNSKEIIGNSYSFYIDGQILKDPVIAYKQENHVLVPLRQIAEAAGYKVIWNQEERSVTLEKDSFWSKLTIDKDAYYFAKMAPRPLGQAPLLIENTTYIPLAFLSDILKYNVAMDEEIIAIRKSQIVNEVTYDLDKSMEGFETDFADLPVEAPQDLYDLDSDHKKIPLDEGSTKAIYMKGHNRSDDLFMYTYKQIGKDEGLEPDSKYVMTINFDLGTGVPEGLGGIGGSPAESVFVKAGATDSEPSKLVDDSPGTPYYRVNFDKGNQMTSGSEVKTLGNIAKVYSMDNSYELKHFNMNTIVETDENGNAYIVIGVDSGFEGETEVYFDNITISYSTINE